MSLVFKLYVKFLILPFHIKGRIKNKKPPIIEAIIDQIKINIGIMMYFILIYCLKKSCFINV